MKTLLIRRGHVHEIKKKKKIKEIVDIDLSRDLDFIEMIRTMKNIYLLVVIDEFNNWEWNRIRSRRTKLSGESTPSNERRSRT